MGKKSDGFDPEQSLDEFIAEMEGKHGKKMAKAILKSMGIEPVDRRKSNPRTQHHAGVPTKVLDARPSIVALAKGANLPKGVPLNEQTHKTVDQIKVRIRRTGRQLARRLCQACGDPLGDDDHVEVTGRGSGLNSEYFHQRCVPPDLRSGLVEHSI